MTNQEFLESITLDGEEWRSPKDYPQIVVSNRGRVVMLARVMKSYNQYSNIVIPRDPYLMKQSKFNAAKDLQRHGSYLTVTLNKDGRRNRIKVHTLVCDCFVPNPNNYPHIDHINGDRSDNRVENLQRCSAKMNMNNPITKERIRENLTGKPSPLRIPVVAISDGIPIKVYPSLLATKEDLYSPNCVYYCCKGLKDSHKGIQWKYLSDCGDLLSAMSKNSDKGGE